MPSCSTRSRRHLLAATCLAVALTVALAPSPAAAQSCVLTRLDSPVLHAFDPTFDSGLTDQKWEVSLGWRYGKSDRHFVGTDEQEERTREGSQVINDVNLADLELRYNFGPRNSLSAGVPYLMAERSGPVRSGGAVVGRETRSNTDGIGDVALIFHHLLRNPAERSRANLSLGIGLELPTGDDSQDSTRTRIVNGQQISEPADQSVQPGDGGYGIVLQASGYSLLGSGSGAASYGSLTYIVAPQKDNGVPTFRSAPGEEVMSITDQYVARLGAAIGRPSWKGVSLSLGGRIEGIPVHDLVGSSDGFRRPGYMLSVEPSVSWVHGVHSLNLSVPYAVQRNRERSVPDIRRGAHGDAAFPDFIVIAGYSQRF